MRLFLVLGALCLASTLGGRAADRDTNAAPAATQSPPPRLAVDVGAIDRERILKAAAAALALEPVTITKSVAPYSEGGTNDFYSNGDYWWPNPDTTNGLPYVQRDGQSNPGNFIQHRLAIRSLRDGVAALGAAYQITGDDRYVKKAVELLQVFFLDPRTRMNPSLKYAQAIPGVSSGRGTGIIDTLHLAEIPLAIMAMEKSPAFPPEALAGLKRWFDDYSEWMRTSANGLQEAGAGNNHAVAFWLQVATFARLTDNETNLAECRRQFKQVFLPKQMAGDGSFPAELRRTKPYGYSIFQLDNIVSLCQVLSTPDDNLWTFETADGKSIRKAVAFLYPYLEDKSKWPRKPDVQAWDGWPARQPCLLFAGLAFSEPKYLDLWRRLKPDPTDDEVRRNIAITQPLLWIGSAATAPAPPGAKPKPAAAGGKSSNADAETVRAEHSDIGLPASRPGSSTHTTHPDAQWYPDAGFGLFIHWGISSVKAMNISWPMIPGRALASKRITDPAERERIIREGDYNLTGRPNEITPNAYWEMAKDFNPQKYDPETWLKAAKEAGFVYAVLTTRHHEGFALWPSAFGNFNTKNYMDGRDLVKPYVEACRRNGIKVGFYYSPPDWYFEKDYKDFMYGRGHQNNPEFPPLGPDLKPRTAGKSPEEIARHRADYAAMVRGQVEELLTRYGKIDVLWFDGRPPGLTGDQCISLERIRELQPGIVVNPRLHGRGDFVTYERNLTTDKVADGWAEFCNTWTTGWSHQNIPFRAPGYVLGQLVRCRALHVNYLLGVGPMATGEFCSGIYENMAVVAEWMKHNAASVKGTRPLPAGETASVPATASDSARYLFALPVFRNGGAYEKDLLPAEDATLTLNSVRQPAAVRLLGDGTPLKFGYADRTVTVELPAARRSRLVDVVQVELSPAN